MSTNPPDHGQTPEQGHTPEQGQTSERGHTPGPGTTTGHGGSSEPLTNPLPVANPLSADLSHLSATDALLDRLAARRPLPGDLRDPAVEALIEMVTAIDDVPEPDLGLSRLVEVLGGRPLYISAQVEAEPEVEPAPVAESRVIDLTVHGRPVVEIYASDAELVGHPNRDRAADREWDRQRAAERGVLAFLPRQVASSRWARVVSQAALPAASVVALLVLGGGVSAAVTGSPMTAVNSFSRVVAQLPGVGNSENGVTAVRGEISAASTAVQRNDKSAATMHLEAARRGLSDVPDDTKPQLNNLIATVQTQLNATPTATAQVVVASPSGPVVVPDTPTPTTAPSDPATDPASSPSPTDTPAETPTGAPTDTQSPGSTPNPGDPTPASPDTNS